MTGALSLFRLAGEATAKASALGFDLSRFDLRSRRGSKAGSAEQSQKPVFETGKPKPRKTLVGPKWKSEVRSQTKKGSHLRLLDPLFVGPSVLGRQAPKQKGIRRKK